MSGWTHEGGGNLSAVLGSLNRLPTDGAQAGSTLGVGPLRLLGTAQATRYVAGWRETTWELAVGARWAAGTWGGVDVQVGRFAHWQRLAEGIQVRGMLYF